MSDPQATRPFYELPAHYKPCSRIIKETQMQLQYGQGGKVAVGLGVGVSDRDLKTSSPNLDYGENEDLLYGNSIARHGTADFGVGLGIRAVYTKRPFTPRDSVNLWGSSARKRPPSAITLSRLVLDEGDESRCLPSDLKIPAEAGGLSRPLERTTRKLQSLSLSNAGDGDGEQAVNTNADRMRTRIHSRVAAVAAPVEQQINNLEAAIESLDEWIMDNSARKGQNPNQAVPKSEIIATLKRINANISSIDAHSLDKSKTRLLKLLFRLVERNQNDEDILFWSSFILLHCHITGNNLTTVYKMIFKASKCMDYLDTINESDYLQTFLESFSHVSPLTQTETVIYGYGILKFLCSEDYILFRVIELNLIEIMTVHLRVVNDEVEKRNEAISENIQNGMFQLTSILRTVVGIPACLDHVAECGLLKEVCNSLPYTMNDADVLSNIVRILSVVSEHELCGEVISDNAKFCRTIAKILQVWHCKEDIIVRLMYCLGNVLGKFPAVRVRLYNEPLAYQMIIQIIFYYLENSTSTSSSEDILVKSIRLLANWSLDPNIGAELSEEEKLNEILSTILGLDVGMGSEGQAASSPSLSRELLVCVVATLNNLSYYKDCGNSDEISKRTVESILVYLNSEDIELRTEVTKVLGNLTRNSEVRKSCSEYIGALLLSLEENEEYPDLLYATIGVLINIIADNNCKGEFVRKQGLHYLIDLLDRTHNVRLSLMISQLLWNLLLSTAMEDEDDGLATNYFHKEEINELCQTMTRKMEEYAYGGSGNENGNGDREGTGKSTSISTPSPAPPAGHQFAEDYRDFVSLSSSLYDKLSRTLAG